MARKKGSGMDNRRHRNRITAEIPVWCLYVCPECGKGAVAPTAYAVCTWYEYYSSTPIYERRELRDDAVDQLRHVVEHELKVMDAGTERVSDKLEGMKCICPQCGHYGFKKRDQKNIFGRYRYLRHREAARVLEAAYKSPILISRNVQTLKKAAANFEAYHALDWDWIAERCAYDGHGKVGADAIMEQVRC